MQLRAQAQGCGQWQKAPTGRKKFWLEFESAFANEIFCRPAGTYSVSALPRAYALGCIISPLRGCGFGILRKLLHPSIHIIREPLNKSSDVLRGIELVVVNQRR